MGVVMPAAFAHFSRFGFYARSEEILYCTGLHEIEELVADEISPLPGDPPKIANGNGHAGHSNGYGNGLAKGGSDGNGNGNGNGNGRGATAAPPAAAAGAHAGPSRMLVLV